MRLILVNYKIINIWDDEGSRKDIVGCVRLSFKMRGFSFKLRAFSFS